MFQHFQSILLRDETENTTTDQISTKLTILHSKRKTSLSYGHSLENATLEKLRQNFLTIERIPMCRSVSFNSIRFNTSNVMRIRFRKSCGESCECTSKRGRNRGVWFLFISEYRFSLLDLLLLLVLHLSLFLFLSLLFLYCFIGEKHFHKQRFRNVQTFHELCWCSISVLA